MPIDPQNDPDFMKAPMSDQVKYLSHVDADFAKADPRDQMGYLLHLQGLGGSPAGPVKPQGNIPDENMLTKVSNRIGDQLHTANQAITQTLSPEGVRAIIHGFGRPSPETMAHPIAEPAKQVYNATIGPIVNDISQARSKPENVLSDILMAGMIHQASGGALPEDAMPMRGVPESTPSAISPAVAKILKGHIPVVGKYLRTIDDVRELLGKDAPHPSSTANIAPAKVPETNGIPWGSGGQGPLDLRGKMIPDVKSPYDVVQLSGAKTPAAQGATPKLPEMKPSQSTTISHHGFDPGKQQMYVTFKNGNTYRYSGVPQKVFDQYMESESQGSFHAQNIKGRYKTDLVSKGKPTTGQKVSQALGKMTPSGRALTPEELAIQAQPGSTGIAPDLANWQPPPELGVSNAPDYGQKVRAETQSKFGPLKRGEEK